MCSKTEPAVSAIYCKTEPPVAARNSKTEPAVSTIYSKTEPAVAARSNKTKVQ
jgi:hypothetical protein